MHTAALSIFLCHHTTNNAIDRLSDMCKNNFDDANIIRVYGTKRTAIIKNVLAPI